MAAPLLADVTGLWYWLNSPATLFFGLFQLWMLVDAIRRQEWVWVAFLVLVPGFSALWYFFYVYRDSPSATRGFELPGAHDRKRIKQLERQGPH